MHVCVCAWKRVREKQKLMYMYAFPRVVANYVSMRFECGRTIEAGINPLYWLFGSRHTVCSAAFGAKTPWQNREVRRKQCFLVLMKFQVLWHRCDPGLSKHWGVVGLSTKSFLMRFQHWSTCWELMVFLFSSHILIIHTLLLPGTVAVGHVERKKTSLSVLLC